MTRGTFALPSQDLLQYVLTSPVSSASSTQLCGRKSHEFSEKSYSLTSLCFNTFCLQKGHLHDSGKGPRKSAFTFPTADSELREGRA